MESTPAGATRMGSRSSTRHGGPAQVFVGPVRKWRKAWTPVSSTSPSPSAPRVLLYKWTPLTPSNGIVKEDSDTLEDIMPSPPRPVKYLPVSVVIQRRKEQRAREVEEQIEEAQVNTENQNQVTEDKTTDMVVDPKQEVEVDPKQEMVLDPKPETPNDPKQDSKQVVDPKQSDSPASEDKDSESHSQ